MKIRHGFVSNSSSSSFCYLGAFFSANELRKMLSIPEDVDVAEHCYDLFSGAGLDVTDGLTNYQGNVIIGKDVHSIPRDKTLLEVEAEIVEKLREVFAGVSAQDVGWRLDEAFDY